MRKELLIIALGLSAVAGAATADVLSVPETQARGTVTLPAKGVTMAAVEKKFGAPANKRTPVGGDTPKHPPITRWDYDGFSVIFENDRVIDAVIPGAPPRVYNQDQLTPVAASAAPMAPATPAPAAPPYEPIVPESPAEPAAAAPPAEAAAMPADPPPMAPAEPTAPPETPSATAVEPATAPQPGTYTDQPAPDAPAQDVPQDQPPTPK